MKQFLLIFIILCLSVFNTAYAGDGSADNPYTVSEARALNTGSTMYWVQGFIVGGRYDDFEQPWDGDYAVSIADDPSETSIDNCIQIKLESATGHRTLWGLNSNPAAYGKQIKAHGFRDTYGGATFPSIEGVDNIIDVNGEGNEEPETVQTPTFNPIAGTYPSAQNVSISCSTADASIFYTTDGTTPDNTSTEYLTAVNITESTTFKAIAFKDAIYSSVASAEYTIEISSTDATIPYEQYFSLDIGNFSQESIEGDQVWEWKNFGDGSMTISGYSSESFANTDWLYSPKFDFRNFTDLVLNFNEMIYYLTNYNELQILISTNYDEDAATPATWNELIVTGRSVGNSWDFIDVDPIDLSEYEGESKVTIAFKYTSTSAGSSSWEIGKVSITGTESTVVEPSNHASNFSAISGTITETSIDLRWDENDGEVLASGYLLKASTNAIELPTNGIHPSNDTDLTDGDGVVSLNHGSTNYTFDNCSSGTQYQFSIFPFVETDDTIVYKTIEAPTTEATTDSIEPVNTPTLFEAEVETASTIQLTWQKNVNNDKVVIVYQLYSEVEAIPVDGTIYALNEEIPGGGTVVYKGVGAAFDHINLEPSTYYHYSIWSVSDDTRYSEGVSAHEATLALEPSNAITNFNVDSTTNGSVSLVWDATNSGNNPEGYVLLVNTSENELIVPNDGTDISGDLDLSDGNGATKIDDNDTTFTWENLAPSTVYYFSIYPYVNSGEYIDYKIEDAPIISTSTNSGLTSPQILPVTGTYFDSLEISISCTTAEAIIYYTTDGSDPEQNSMIYENAFTILESVTIKAISVLDDETSIIIEQSYILEASSIEVANPVISPLAGEYADSVKIEITCATNDAVIYYTIDGTNPNEGGIQYTEVFTLYESTVLKTVAVLGIDSSEVSEASFVVTISPIEVNSLAELRKGKTDGTIYHYNGEADVTYAMVYRNQKFIQDQSAAILIDDVEGIILTDFEIGDVISNLTGTLFDNDGMLEFIPTENSNFLYNGVETIAEDVAAPDFISNSEDYESELVTMSVDLENWIFENDTDYEMHINNETIILHTHFYNADYIGTETQDHWYNITGIAIWHEGEAKLVPRSLDDISIGSAINNYGINTRIYSIDKFVMIENAEDFKHASVYTTQGQEIKQLKLSPNEKNQFQIDLPGIYIVVLRGETIKTEKVIIR